MLRDNEFDERLIANVRPAGWTNPEPTGRYNLVVLGAGTAGLVTAAGAAGVGAKVALIERDQLGGDCLNVGCVPSKALLRSAHAVAEIRRAARVGVHVDGETRVDFGEVMSRLRQVRARISPNDSADRFQNELGVDVYFGEARFTGRDEVSVGGTTLQFSKAVIATGARAFVPPIPGLDEAGYLTNESIFDLRELPSRLLVVGGGPIGCELTQAFRRLGSEVTIIEMGEQFLEREDPDAASILFDALESEGVAIRLSTRLTRVEVGEGGSKRAIVENTAAGNAGQEVIPFDEILIAVGRSPNLSGLDLEKAGVRSDARAGVEVDDHLRTSNANIYAAGDICMATKFTHAADFAARAVIQNSLFFGRKRLSALNIPWCTYTDPEIAHVGLYERDAIAKGFEVDTYVRKFSDVDRAITEDDDAGFVKIHTRRGSDRILGATIVARNAGELISEVSVAMAGGLGLAKLSNVIHPYPTQAEAIRQVGDAFNRTRLTPRVKMLFERFLAFRR